jgi:hypothetical protein
MPRFTFDLEGARRVHANAACPDTVVYAWIGRRLPLMRAPSRRHYDEACRCRSKLEARRRVADGLPAYALQLRMCRNEEETQREASHCIRHWGSMPAHLLGVRDAGSLGRAGTETPRGAVVGRREIRTRARPTRSLPSADGAECWHLQTVLVAARPWGGVGFPSLPQSDRLPVDLARMTGVRFRSRQGSSPGGPCGSCHQ